MKKMNKIELNVFYSKSKTRLTELWKFKAFRYSVLLHLLYFTFSVITTLLVLRNKSDFYVYYKVGGIFVNNPNDLFNPAFYTDTWPFRYLPLSAIMFVPYYFMGFDLGFIVFNLIQNP